jgi:hypothetical protein
MTQKRKKRKALDHSISLGTRVLCPHDSGELSIQGSKSKDSINSMVIKLWEEVQETQSELKIPSVEKRKGYWDQS